MHPRARRHLMLETSAVVEIHDLRFAYHSPVKDGRPVLERQGEHEAGVHGARVLIEDGVFKCWHHMHSTSVAGEWASECPFVAYAESTDGIHWERPELGIKEFRGSRKNNYTDLPAKICSILPDVSGEHKYLAVGTMTVEPGPGEVRPEPTLNHGYFTAHSDDGLHWEVCTEPIVLTGCDACYATYDEIEQRYVFIPKLNTRYAGVQARTMCWTDAKEFGKWRPISAILSPTEGDFLEARRHEAIGMDFQHREGDTSQDAAEAIFHDPVTAAQRGHLLGPASSHIDHLDGMDIVTGTTDATVMDCVYFEMPWLLFVPRDPSHGDLSGYPIGLGRAFARQARLILSEAAQEPPYRGHADLAQLI